MWNSNRQGETTLAHITDAHVAPYGRCTAVLKHRSVEILADLVGQLKAASVDAVLFGGDNIDNRGHGEEDLSAFLRVVEPLEDRWLAQFGNHEAAHRRPGRLDKYAFAKAIDGRGVGPRQHDFARTVGDVRVIGIDTTLVGSPGGFVSPETMRFLANELSSAAERHIVVLGHHPIYPAWAPHALDSWDREYLVANRQVICTLLASSSRVRAYLCGHHHATRIQRVPGASPNDGFYHLQTASPAAFPHSGRVLSFTATEMRVRPLRPTLPGLFEEGASWVITGRKSSRYEKLGADRPFLEYLAGTEEDNDVVLLLEDRGDARERVSRVPREVVSRTKA